MKSKVVVGGRERTFVLVLDPPEEAFRGISKVADQENISGASVAAIGAFEHAKVSWFDIEAKRYKPISVNEQCEVLSLIGDIAQGDDAKASLHLHTVLGLPDGSVRGGHLLEGTVRPTLEVTIVDSAAHLRRKKSADSGYRADRFIELFRAAACSQCGHLPIRLRRNGILMIAGAIIGFNRGARGHAAGLRTTILVGLAASVAMIQTNILLPLAGKTPESFAVMDLMRLPLGILTGVGFRGGGGGGGK